VFYGLIVVGTGALVGFGLWLQYRRNQAVQAWARSIGWTYLGTDPSLPSRWRTRPFGIGDSRRTAELMTGVYQGRPATAFRYSYTTGSGKNKSTSVFHVVVVPLPAYLPNLELTPEGIGSRLAETFGGEDIQFESDDFNRAWRVECGMEKFAYDVITPRLMERLLRSDAAGLSIRIDGTDVLCWSTGEQTLEALAPRLELLAAVRDAVPGFVWRDSGYDPGNG